MYFCLTTYTVYYFFVNKPEAYRYMWKLATFYRKAGLKLIKEEQRKGADGNDHEHEITDNVFDLFE